ncbi:unnamed protein product, partial [Rhizoctonia solani]
SQRTTMTISFIDEPSKHHLGFANSYHKYELQVEQESGFGSIYVTAVLKPYEHVNELFIVPEDANFNLSPYIAINDKGELSWDINGGQAVDNLKLLFAGRTAGYERRTQCKVIVVGYIVGTQQREGTLNLDEFLDIVEYYDQASQQFKLRLGVKPSRSKRSIILCFDGTSNKFSNQNTNVIKLVELLKKNDPSEQMVYYQAGIGTYSHSTFKTGIASTMAKWIDEATACFLYQHVIDGYRYLMQTYQAGDKISIFGFSRGAYTARALAGMLHSVGLLPKHNTEQVQFAYEVYAASEKFINKSEAKDFFLGAVNLEEGHNAFFRSCKNTTPFHEPTNVHLLIFNSDREKWLGVVDQNARPKDVNPNCFKMVFCTPVEITFLGVWDTVGSMGALKRTTLPWITHNPSVKNFRQALSLDEVRANFIPTLWDHSKTQPWQTALEVWFKGGHCDVGGGAPLVKSARVSQYVEFYAFLGRKIKQGFLSTIRTMGLSQAQTGVEELSSPAPSEKPQLPNPRPDDQLRQPDLSNISLRWMVNECLSLANVRVLFDPYAMHSYQRAKILEERPHGAEQAEIQKNRRDLDSYDITNKPYQAIDVLPWWLLLEFVPIPRLSQLASKSSESCTVFCPNLRAGRVVYKVEKRDQIRLHYSVFKNITSSDYRPSAEWNGSTLLSDIEDCPESESETEKILYTLGQRWRPHWFRQKTLQWSKSGAGLGWVAVHAGAILYYWMSWRWVRMVLGYTFEGFRPIGRFLIRSGLVEFVFQGATAFVKHMSQFLMNGFSIKG